MKIKRFLFSCSITEASGTQIFFVDAESESEALEIFKSSGGEMYESEVEVTDLGKPELIGQTSMTDFGDFRHEVANAKETDLTNAGQQAIPDEEMLVNCDAIYIANHLTDLVESLIASLLNNEPPEKISEYMVLCGEKVHVYRNLIYLNMLSATHTPESESTAQGGWISTKDRLPPAETPVLILHDGNPRIAELRREMPGFEAWDCPYDDSQEFEWLDVTHWAPLPPTSTTESEL